MNVSGRREGWSEEGGESGCRRRGGMNEIVVESPEAEHDVPVLDVRDHRIRFASAKTELQSFTLVEDVVGRVLPRLVRGSARNVCAFRFGRVRGCAPASRGAARSSPLREGTRYPASFFRRQRNQRRSSKQSTASFSAFPTSS